MKKIKLKSNLEISVMGLGTWAIGGGPAWNLDLDTAVCIDTIHEAIRQGINIIDTAPGYNFGNSEIIVGKALEELIRKDIVVETKCGIIWDGEGSLFNKVGDRQLYKNLSPESIRKEIEESLKRLQIDYIDIYMTHWQSVEPYFTPIEETVKVLNELKEEGKIKAIGAANITADQIIEYQKYGELDIVQAKYNILDREIEQELLPICKKYNIAVQAYSPLEQGLLTGTIDKNYIPTGARANKKWFQKGNMENVIDMLDNWKELCEKYNCNIPSLALAWVLAQGDHISLLSGATSPEQVVENVSATKVKLESGDLKFLDKMVKAIS